MFNALKEVLQQLSRMLTPLLGSAERS